ncbi:MAG: carboxypeptidase regulatory-like domain-containing protein [Longimicrobiaceae bacterium]
MHKPLIALALAGLCVFPSRGAAQDSAPAVLVAGRVLDALSGAPIEGAVVELRDVRRKTAADSSGAFSLRAVPAGMHHWVISRLGYAAWEEDMEVEDGDEFTVRLLPRPEVLEGITAVASRLQLRRQSAGVMVRALEPGEIKLSAAPDVAALVHNRFGVSGVPCPAYGGSETERTCAWIRGELIPVGVYIDERRATGGLDDLSYYLPQEIYSVEAYYGGAVIRVITDTFAARLARGQATLMPLGS